MTAPPAAVREQLEQLLEKDTSRVGDVYRLRDRSSVEIARALGVDSSGFVANNRTIIRALLDGEIPVRPSIALQVASKVRTLSRSPLLDEDARGYLAALEQRLAQTQTQTQTQSTAAPTLSPPVTEPPSSVTGPDLRRHVEDELRARTRLIVERIKREVGVDATDYWAVVTSMRPLDVIVRLIRSPGEVGTFKRLTDAGRLDLSLDSAVVAWSEDLPIQTDLVEDAVARRDWFSS